MGLLDGNAGPLPSKIPRYVMMGAVAVLALGTLLFIVLRNRTEKATARLFLSQVVAGDLQSAYRTWKPSSGYSFDDFTSDWGPAGQFGPVKSFEVYSARRRGDASGVVVTVEVSAYSPFPDSGDPKSRNNKVIDLWIESGDHSMSFAPQELNLPR
ncbi:MAG TPA: hypothetical protein VKG84_15035 [Candidatus Acidoferrales bacterium]|nr:hypothetical protein [Candidatus Acidoferrales bacterium]